MGSNRVNALIVGTLTAIFSVVAHAQFSAFGGGSDFLGSTSYSAFGSPGTTDYTDIMASQTMMIQPSLPTYSPYVNAPILLPSTSTGSAMLNSATMAIYQQALQVQTSQSALQAYAAQEAAASAAAMAKTVASGAFVTPVYTNSMSNLLDPSTGQPADLSGSSSSDQAVPSVCIGTASDCGGAASASITAPTLATSGNIPYFNGTNFSGDNNSGFWLGNNTELGGSLDRQAAQSGINAGTTAVDQLVAGNLASPQLADTLALSQAYDQGYYNGIYGAYSGSQVAMTGWNLPTGPMVAYNLVNPLSSIFSGTLAQNIDAQYRAGNLTTILLPGEYASVNNPFPSDTFMSTPVNPLQEYAVMNSVGIMGSMSSMQSIGLLPSGAAALTYSSVTANSTASAYVVPTNNSTEPFGMALQHELTQSAIFQVGNTAAQDLGSSSSLTAQTAQDALNVANALTKISVNNLFGGSLGALAQAPGNLVYTNGNYNILSVQNFGTEMYTQMTETVPRFSTAQMNATGSTNNYLNALVYQANVPIAQAQQMVNTIQGSQSFLNMQAALNNYASLKINGK